MATVALASFAPTASIPFQATQASGNVLLPTTGTPTIVVVTNLGQQAVFVALGGSTVSVIPNGGLAIMPGDNAALTIGANTYLAVVSLNGLVGLNITVGN